MIEGRVVRLEESGTIVIELTFAPPQINSIAIELLCSRRTTHPYCIIHNSRVLDLFVYLQGYEYLVCWQDYTVYDFTWEPERHLPTAVVSNFVLSEIVPKRLSEFSVSFERAIQYRLRCRNPKAVVFVDFDVFRHVFGPENTVLCYPDDFKKLNLSDHWYYVLKKDGNGRKIKFPIKLSIRLCIRKMYVKNQGRLVEREAPLEKCSIYSCTEACALEDV